MNALEKLENKLKNQCKEELTEIVDKFFKDIKNLKDNSETKHHFAYYIDVGNGEVMLYPDNLKNIILHTLEKAHLYGMLEVKSNELLTDKKLI